MHKKGAKHNIVGTWREPRGDGKTFVSLCFLHTCTSLLSFTLYDTTSASVSASSSPSGWRLCNWQLYKAHSHRRTGHHLLHPAAPQGEGGGHPAGAVAGDGQGSQGRSSAVVPLTRRWWRSLMGHISDSMYHQWLTHKGLSIGFGSYFRFQS